eukprot:Gb_18527 [translate_table: standard]
MVYMLRLKYSCFPARPKKWYQNQAIILVVRTVERLQIRVVLVDKSLQWFTGAKLVYGCFVALNPALWIYEVTGLTGKETAQEYRLKSKNFIYEVYMHMVPDDKKQAYVRWPTRSKLTPEDIWGPEGSIW